MPITTVEAHMIQTESSNRILIVEDDPTIQRVIELCLKRRAKQIDLRGDGDSGLAAARDLDPDLVILDIALPGIDGWEVLRQLRSKKGDQVAVLIVTASAGQESRMRAEESGADGFITKPFHPEELRAAVDRLCP